MSTDDKRTEPDRKSVGVYDRPASADRARTVKMWVFIIAIAVSAISAYFFFFRT